MILLDKNKKYNNLFRFLLPFRRTQILLNKEWIETMRMMARGSSRSLVSSLTTLRWKMGFFVNSIMSYFQVDVLEAQWAHLEEAVSKSKDFEEVRHLHDKYLINITTQSLLPMSKLVRALEEALQICWKFCFFLDRIGTAEELKEELSSELGDIEEQFEGQSELIFKMMSNVKKNQSSPFLSQLLLRLASLFEQRKRHKKISKKPLFSQAPF